MNILGKVGHFCANRKTGTRGLVPAAAPRENYLVENTIAPPLERFGSGAPALKERQLERMARPRLIWQTAGYN